MKFLHYLIVLSFLSSFRIDAFIVGFTARFAVTVVELQKLHETRCNIYFA